MSSGTETIRRKLMTSSSLCRSRAQNPEVGYTVTSVALNIHISSLTLTENMELFSAMKSETGCQQNLCSLSPGL